MNTSFCSEYDMVFVCSLNAWLSLLYSDISSMPWHGTYSVEQTVQAFIIKED